MAEYLTAAAAAAILPDRVTPFQIECVHAERCSNSGTYSPTTIIPPPNVVSNFALRGVSSFKLFKSFYFQVTDVGVKS